jgi:hypothetical protein
MTELAVIMASGDITLINIGPNKAVDEASLAVLLDAGAIPSIKQGAFQVVDEDTINTILASGSVPDILFNASQALNEVNLPVVYPFSSLTLTNVTNPGWVDVDTFYPAVVGAPAPDQVELRITDVVVAGTYIISISSVFNLDEDKESAFGRFSTDGGATWLEFAREPKDKSDLIAIAYNFPYVHAGGPFNFVWQMRREDAGENGVLDVKTSNMWYERKL